MRLRTLASLLLALVTSAACEPLPRPGPDEVGSNSEQGPTHLQKRGRPIDRIVDDTNWDLAMISQPMDWDRRQPWNMYRHDSNAGKHVTIYIISKGFRSDHAEFRADPPQFIKKGILNQKTVPATPRIRTIKVGGKRNPFTLKRKRTYPFRSLRGTCVAAKAAGNTAGAAAEANLVLVDRLDETDRTHLAAWKAVLKDILKNHPPQHANIQPRVADAIVVDDGYFWKTESTDQSIMTQLRETLHTLLNTLSVPVVVPPGRVPDRNGEPVPSTWKVSGRDPAMSSLNIVVPVDASGRTHFATGWAAHQGFMTTAAPGIGVRCPKIDDPFGWVEGNQYGASLGLVAGVIASWMATDGTTLDPSLGMARAAFETINANQFFRADMTDAARQETNARLLMMDVRVISNNALNARRQNVQAIYHGVQALQQAGRRGRGRGAAGGVQNAAGGGRGAAGGVQDAAGGAQNAAGGDANSMVFHAPPDLFDSSQSLGQDWE